MADQADRHRLALAAITATCLVAGLTGFAGQAGAATPPVTDPRVVAHFDLSAGQTPENLALEPDGAVDESFSFAAQIARVSLDGSVHPLAQLPSSPTTGCAFSGAHAVANAHRDQCGLVGP